MRRGLFVVLMVSSACLLSPLVAQSQVAPPDTEMSVVQACQQNIRQSPQGAKFPPATIGAYCKCLFDADVAMGDHPTEALMASYAAQCAEVLKGALPGH